MDLRQEPGIQKKERKNQNQNQEPGFETGKETWTWAGEKDIPYKSLIQSRVIHGDRERSHLGLRNTGIWEKLRDGDLFLCGGRPMLIDRRRGVSTYVLIHMSYVIQRPITYLMVTCITCK